jgi:hypothetical protein
MSCALRPSGVEPASAAGASSDCTASWHWVPWSTCLPACTGRPAARHCAFLPSWHISMARPLRQQSAAPSDPNTCVGLLVYAASHAMATNAAGCAQMDAAVPGHCPAWQLAGPGTHGTRRLRHLLRGALAGLSACANCLTVECCTRLTQYCVLHRCCFPPCRG